MPNVVEPLHAAAAPGHHAGVAHILALGPVAGFIHQVGVFLFVLNGVFQGNLATSDLPESHHVGLAE